MTDEELTTAFFDMICRQALCRPEEHKDKIGLMALELKKAGATRTPQNRSRSLMILRDKLTEAMGAYSTSKP